MYSRCVLIPLCGPACDYQRRDAAGGQNKRILYAKEKKIIKKESSSLSQKYIDTLLNKKTKKTKKIF